MANRTARAVLITGCTPGGIGHCCALRAREAGYRVLATARRQEVVAALQKEGFEAHRLDLADSSSIAKAVEWVADRTGGKLYALFNNAAYGQPGAVEDLSRDVLKEQFETNLFGTHELTVKLLPMMLANQEGRIIQNSSVLGFVALRFRGAYNASKFALEGLSDTLRLELQGTGVDVVLIEPGPIRSRFRQNALKMFVRRIDYKASRLADEYEKKLAALRSEEDAPFTLGAEAVAKVFLKALNSKRPKPRYRVTLPTSLFYWIKKGLPDRAMDAILRAIE